MVGGVSKDFFPSPYNSCKICQKNSSPITLRKNGPKFRGKLHKTFAPSGDPYFGELLETSILRLTNTRWGRFMKAIFFNKELVLWVSSGSVSLLNHSTSSQITALNHRSWSLVQLLKNSERRTNVTFCSVMFVMNFTS